MAAERLNFDIEQSVDSRLWLNATGHLIVTSSSAQLDHCSRVLARIGATKLDKPPDPSELDHFKSIIVLDDGQYPDGADLRVRSLWIGNGQLSNMGALFPALQPGVENFQTMRGILYPETVVLRPNVDMNNPPTTEQWLQALTRQKVWCLTNLLSPRKKAKALETLLMHPQGPRRLGIWGIGDIGKYVATSIRELDVSVSGISELFIGGSTDTNTIEGLAKELADINVEGIRQPIVRKILPHEEEKYFEECDIILILAASGILPPGASDQLDVRAEQYQRNSKIVEDFVMHAAKSGYDGQILVGSDPIEQLAMHIYQTMRRLGIDINTHQIQGFGGMINRSRAMRMANDLGILPFKDSGRTFGPHGKMVLAFPTHNAFYYDERQAEVLSSTTGKGNYEIRKTGNKPFYGPAVLIKHGIQEMGRQGGVIYTSPFLPSNDPERSSAAFFGTRVQVQPSGLLTPYVEQPFLSEIMGVLERDHRWVAQTSLDPDMLQTDPFSFAEHTDDHPAFHPYVMERWEKEAGQKRTRE